MLTLAQLQASRTSRTRATPLGRAVGALVLLAAAAVLVLPAGAFQGAAPAPGSLLLFPEFDRRQGRRTLITVTNTANQPGQSIRVEFVYVDALTCLDYRRTEFLTPRDTITLHVTTHNPNSTHGYLYAYAVSTGPGVPVEFDHLIGHSIVLDAIGTFDYSLNPLVYRSPVPVPGQPTDLDLDGVRDLDDHEYEAAPDEILIPRFLGQGGGTDGKEVVPDIDSDLILISLAGRAFQTEVYFEIFNDNEQIFSGTRSFFCWEKVPLASISPIFLNSALKDFTQHAPNEIQGGSGLESGWFTINGLAASSPSDSFQNPAVIGVLLERSGAQAASDLPFGRGRNLTGGLLSSSPFSPFP